MSWLQAEQTMAAAKKKAKTIQALKEHDRRTKIEFEKGLERAEACIRHIVTCTMI